MSINFPKQLRRVPILRQVQRRFDSLPRPEPEDSILLRVLVQVLVTLGIIATDVAAIDAAGSLNLSFWAVPLSALGATWSWHRRRDRNVSVQFCIAIGMLVVLAVFFVRLVSEINDTRLALAELLIQLQVLHTFDLPRRKDLGYSMVIGLILLGVAGTLSQTLTLGPLLLLFLAIALPVLVLDYRSRLGLVSRNFKRVGIDLSLKRLSVFLAVTLALGLTIFMFLPRLPGYQLQTFPVSAPIDFPGQFDGSTITNPGYVREGRGRSTLGDGTGTDRGRGPGEIDDNFYYGFNSTINQNLRGQMTPRVVMRVRSQAEGFWRVLAFDRYTGQGWEISRNEETQKVRRFSWSYRFLIPWVPNFNRTREVIQTYNIVSDLPNLVPVLFEPKELYFPTEEVAIDLEGSLRAPVELLEGITYTVISEVPYRDRTILRRAATDYPTEIQDYYLQVPPELIDRVRQRTEELLDTSPNPLTDPYEQALYLTQALKQRYEILPDLPPLAEGEDLVEAFLFKYQGGYPDHFSTVLTVMLRSIGVPTRLVAGFGPGEFNPLTGYYVVKNTDAYAMTEVYFPNHGWFAFDPIPGHELFPPSVEDYQTFSVLRQFWNWVAGWLPSPVSGFLNKLFELLANGLGRAIAWLTLLFSQGWVGVFIGTGILISLGFLSWLGWNGWRSWRYHRWLAKLPPVERIYQQMLSWLTLKGFRKPASQTPLEYARQSYQHHSATHARIIDEISQAYVRWRYGGQTPNLNQLRQQLQELKKKQPKNS